jgi:signal transduction histidine kinase
MTDLLQSSLGPSVQIETRFPLGLPKITADANQLELALLNLAMNARDAMPNGGSIVISAHERCVTKEPGIKPGRYACVSVTDTGTGMDRNPMHTIEPFYTTKGVGKGTRLGLPMVHGMAGQSGGKLVLKSKPGEGTTVELCLLLSNLTTRVRQTPMSARRLPRPARLQSSALTTIPLLPSTHARCLKTSVTPSSARPAGLRH